MLQSVRVQNGSGTNLRLLSVSPARRLDTGDRNIVTQSNRSSRLNIMWDEEVVFLTVTFYPQQLYERTRQPIGHMKPAKAVGGSLVMNKRDGL